MKHKRQHWVPQGYLKAWCDPASPVEHEPFVWRFSRDGRSRKKKSPRKLFFENELYTLHDASGGRDLCVEHGLAGLEDSFVKIREQKLDRGLQLDLQDDLVVRAFIAAMQSRRPGQLDHWRSNFQRLAEAGARIEAAVRAGGASTVGGFSGGGPSMSQEEVERIAGAERGALVFPMIQAQLPIICQMTLSFLVTNDPTGFITSDAPCVWADPEVDHGSPYHRGPGLGSRSIEVSLPASPSLTLLLSWNLAPGFLPATTKDLDEINRRTRWRARDYFVVRGKELRQAWFASGPNEEGTTQTG